MAWRGPGFVDHHTHLLRVAAGVPPAWSDSGVAQFHRDVADRGSTPMDEPLAELPPRRQLIDRFAEKLEWARSLGLVEIWEAGLADWEELHALRELRERGPLPVRVRVLVASAIAEPRMNRLEDPWVDVVGVKFYADGWVGPRTCACSKPFADDATVKGVLFMDADALTRRSAPFFDAGWTIATHAIGDVAIEACLDAYERVAGGDAAAVRAAAPRIEHAQVLREDLIDRMADLGVVACIQPSFAVSDAEAAAEALGDQFPHAYQWERLLKAGVPVICGNDYPIETLSPLAGMRDLVAGSRDGDEPVAPTLAVDVALSLMTNAASGEVVLSDDPKAVTAADLADIEVVDCYPAG